MSGPAMAWLRRMLRAATLTACVALAACGGRVDLLGAVPEDEANEVLSALLEAHITADKVPGKEGAVGVRVDGAQVGRALEVLRAKGLPRERFDGMGKVFKKEGLISSPLEERARYIYALSQELSSTLSKMDGVLAPGCTWCCPSAARPARAAWPPVPRCSSSTRTATTWRSCSRRSAGW
jgi:type III secretion protein J